MKKAIVRTERGKTCTKCGELRLFSDFYPLKVANDGLAYYCKPCTKQDARDRYRDMDISRKSEYKKRAIAWRKALTSQQRTAYKKSWVKKMKDERPEEYKEYKRKVNRRKHEAIKKDPRKRMARNIRKRLYDIIKCNKGYKPESFSKLTGCTTMFLYSHIEKKFKKGMSWENYGEWHIDHIKPISKFNLNKKEEVEEINHYTNLQPLWAEENILKGDSYDG